MKPIIDSHLDLAWNALAWGRDLHRFSALRAAVSSPRVAKNLRVTRPEDRAARTAGRVDGRERLRSFAIAIVVFAALAPAATRAADDPAEVTPQLRQQAVEILRNVLDNEERWVKVHAAEFLLALDYPQGVKETFTKELERFAAEPEYRIGIWRVLARAAHQKKDRDRWVSNIRDVFLDSEAPDRLHAAETLAKLRYKVPDDKKRGAAQRKTFEEAAESSNGVMAACVRWVLVDEETGDGEAAFCELLGSEDARTRGIAAYAVRNLDKISPATRTALIAAAKREPTGPKKGPGLICRNGPEGASHKLNLVPFSARIHLVAAAAVHASPENRAEWKEHLREYALASIDTERYQVCDTLARIGDRRDLALLTQLIEDPTADVRSAAADAILRIDRRRPHSLAALDWAVIGVYFIGMLAVGWYYSRRTTTTEDYLLGGRNMKSLNVGLSLFATLLSTISYLAWPGEIIRYGPMVLAMIIAYPLAALVVGWFMIPFIMKLKVTSAYEILEYRLGLSVRMLGSVFFLSMRLLWMAVIIYATVGKVLVPLLGLDPSATPWLCALLGLITVTYTSMGGLKAVVLTDVLQTVILLGGAVLTLVLITYYLGGVGAWWSTDWAAHWPEPKLYHPTERITFFGIILATFTWWVCTSGSDQMAIQRYLATRDVKAARNVLITALAANTVVNLLLTPVGLAILVYFRLNPQLIPDGQTILSDADTLFPRFIAIGLPVGLSGLVIAGLLAAAMSSLSSGVNSSCSVITVDFIDRFRKNKESETDHVRLAKYVSVFVGIVVVVLSAYVGMVEGNLLTIAYKVVNLLVAPLFGLFFMAMFVRWATGPGTLIGAAFGLVTVVFVSYWKEITGTDGISFIWAMPLGLLIQVTAGMIASLLPIGRKRPLGARAKII